MEVKEKLSEMKKKSVFIKIKNKKKTDLTDWISSLVIVAKLGKIRLCLDPKDLRFKAIIKL